MTIRNTELICDVVEALEEIRELGEWKQFFLAVYRAELARTGKPELAKEEARKAVRWVKSQAQEAA